MSNYKNIINKNLADVNQANYYWFKNAFTDDEIDKIHNFASKYEFRKGGIGKEGTINKIRNSKIKWLPSKSESEWLYEKIFDYTKKANDAVYKFRLHYSEDSFQYSLYEGNVNGKYDWHLDIGMGSLALRKLSGVLLLSDPSEFEGGELQIFKGSNPVTVPLKKGSLVFFPSFMLHRVTPVTSGERRTLVFWIGGDHYL